MKRTGGIILSALLLTAVTTGAESTHEVKKGDTLWDISRQYYGDNWKWPIIWQGNVFINNPDLIYPKEKLFIPGFPEGGEAIRIGEGGLFKLEAGTAASESTSAGSGMEAADGLNSFGHDSLNAFDSVLDEEPEFTVISTEQKREMVSTGDFITIDAGTEKGLNTGDTVILYEKRSRVEKNRAVYSCVGYARIVKAGDETSKAEIYKSFSSVSTGFKAAVSKEMTVKRPKGFRSIDSDISGEVVYLAENHTFSAEGYSVIVNIGHPLPVKEGDKFRIFRRLEENGVVKTEPVGEGQLIIVNGKYSTMYLVGSGMEIMKGDIVRLSKIAVY
ncbi:LysM peptidoglycan-binding domain-containing protein [Geovibrio thiophilus]|uniref:LysM peptidoglycan-binding domain-containing protein n=1 Tax=Geovibrio thiophilus TaxID=139438 RepID=UPI0013E2E380|nr:LysM peptidoglycan-binding domain-containing protein [Geovibrio thiophilus]